MIHLIPIRKQKPATACARRLDQMASFLIVPHPVVSQKKSAREIHLRLLSDRPRSLRLSNWGEKESDREMKLRLLWISSPDLSGILAARAVGDGLSGPTSGLTRAFRIGAFVPTWVSIV